MQLFGSLAPALDRIRSSVQQIGDVAGRPHGWLRINTSYVAYAALFEPHLQAFLARFPDITLEVTTDNALSDIVAHGFDAGVRLGHALQKDMISVPIGPVQRPMVVGAPAYLRAHGTPTRPEDLLQHDCIRQRIGSRGQLMEWRFHAAGKPLTIEARGQVVFSEMRCTLEAACSGHGLALEFEPFARKALASGQVVAMLERHTEPGENLRLYYPNRAQMPCKLRALIDFMHAAHREGAPPAANG